MLRRNENNQKSPETKSIDICNKISGYIHANKKAKDSCMQSGKRDCNIGLYLYYTYTPMVLDVHLAKGVKRYDLQGSSMFLNFV